MPTAIEYEQAIGRVQSQHGLIKLWEKLVDDKYDKSFWKEGKLLEYLVLRGFEIERKGCVTYPYEVIDEDVEYDGPIEQIDGAVHVDELHALIECKDYDKAKIKVEPFTKMRNQLARRHASVFGMFFTSTNLTTPAEIQLKYMAPQLIIIWTKDDIEYCIKNRRFISCMKEKYRKAIENCVYNYAFYLGDKDLNKYIGEPLF